MEKTEKKTYVQPDLIVVELHATNQLLAGSVTGENYDGGGDGFNQDDN